MGKTGWAAIRRGEEDRCALAGLLAAQPDVLLLDEPDNHLDLEAKAWLERLLSRSEGAVATITHDRYFVDRIMNRIFELAHGKITVYHGNYSYYRDERQSRHERATELRELRNASSRNSKPAPSSSPNGHARTRVRPACENMRRKLEEEREKLVTRIPNPRSSPGQLFVLD
ncbi:MAG: hypothetical protein R2855_09885 [Thermomicrobiales bacterium]